MCNNYFVKLLMLAVKEGEYLLLYGFCSVTNQEPYEWSQCIVRDTKRIISKAILTEEEFNAFFEGLVNRNDIQLGKDTFISPSLHKRSDVLSNDGVNKSKGPVNEFRRLTEFWNVNKNELVNSIEQSIGTKGKDLYLDMKNLFDWMSGESGIDFISNGHRLGNFEFYHQPIQESDFEIEVHKESGLLKTTVKKMYQTSNKLIVNCISEHRERTICNKTKIFSPEEQIIEFEAEEPMSKVVVQIWDESGELIFSYNGTLMMRISMSMNVGDSTYNIRDPWSQELFKTASNRNEIIKNSIEKVVHTSKFNNGSIKSNFLNEIDVAVEEGDKIMLSYPRSKMKGAFIEKVQKDGEIQSFIKIREYIEEPSVKHVIIADPYFSIVAAGKILARISRNDVQVEVITSLTGVDPDSGKSTGINEGDKLRYFLEVHSDLLAPNLLVRNLKRGEKQVFHDRYLLRYFEDGRIDGFLLSNSLNSMGQFYPFVIAPLDYEVCLEIGSYLETMCDVKKQNLLSRKERITCDVLYDSKNRKEVQQQQESDILFSKEWLSQWCSSEQELQIPEQDIFEAVSIVMNHWDEDGDLACRTLCSILSAVSISSLQNVIEAICNIDGLKELFMGRFIALAREIEGKRKNMKKGIDRQEYFLRMLLSGNAEPSRSGFSMITKRAGHLWYDTIPWINTGYILLLWLDPKKYMDLMENTKSPMMLDSLANQLLTNVWSSEVICLISENDNLYVQLVCADCILERMKMGKITIEDSKVILNQISLQNRLIQMVRLLSEITFGVRTKILEREVPEKEQWNLLCNWLMDSIAVDIVKTTSEIQSKAIYWLNDCETISNCSLHLQLAERISDSTIKNELFDKVINSAQKELFDCAYERDMGKVILLLLEGTFRRYGNDSERKILKYIDWSVFEDASEPELKNYAYTRWRKASIRAKYQLQLLHSYLKMNPNSLKAKQCLKIWEKRIG